MQLITFKPIHGGAIALAALLQFSSPTSMQGAVPPNDTCAGAAAIPAAGPFPYLTPLVPDITDAATAGDPLTPLCANSVSRSIWYTFTPAQTALYSLSLAYDTATTVEDTVMAIYTSSGGCAGSFNIVACSDDEVEVESRSAIATNLSASTTYYIVVWKFGSAAPTNGETAIQLRVNQPVTPANDTCSGAETIPASGPFPYRTMITDTFQATSANDPPLPSCEECLEGVVSRTVWYKFTPAATATYTLSSCAGTATTILDTVMAIYTSSSACGGTFTEVECNDTDNECDEDRAVVSTFLSAGTNYFVVLSECDAQPPGPGRTLVQLLISVPPPRFTSFMKLANGHFKARFSGVTGQAYTMQTSTNLVHWTDLGAPTSLGTNTFEFIDTAAMGFSARFYRVKSP